LGLIADCIGLLQKCPALEEQQESLIDINQIIEGRASRSAPLFRSKKAPEDAGAFEFCD
jgi:hypothetical protein